MIVEYTDQVQLFDLLDRAGQNINEFNRDHVITFEFEADYYLVFFFEKDPAKGFHAFCIPSFKENFHLFIDLQMLVMDKFEGVADLKTVDEAIMKLLRAADQVRASQLFFDGH